VSKAWVTLGVGLIVGLGALALWRTRAELPPPAKPTIVEPAGPTPDQVRELGRKAAAGDRFSAAAAVELSKVASPSARPALREIAVSPDPMASANALHALGNLRDPADLPLFRDIVKTRAGQRPWGEAVRALGKARATSDLEPLLSAPDEQDRLAVLSALKDAARKESAPALQNFLSRPGLSETEKVYAELALRACR